MATIAEMLVQIGVNLDSFESNMKKMEKDLSGFGSKMQRMGTQLATSFGAAGGAIAAGLGLSVKSAMDFESQMSRVGAIAGASAKELDAMRDTALQLGAATSKSAKEVAIGMEEMAAMGFNANEVMKAMPGVIAAAEASGSDMALVADTMAVALRSFGLEASQSTRVADVLAKTANISAAGMEDMALTLKYAAGPAHTLGVSLEELGAATAIMANAGIRGETAGTTLRGALLGLAAPSKGAATELKELGVKITDAHGNMLPFQQIIAQMKSGMEGWGNAQKAAALETIFGREAVSGMMAVIDAGPEKLKELTVELQNSGGASAEAATLMKDNLAGALQQLSGSFETMQIIIGNALTPAIQVLAGWLQSLTDWFNQLSPDMQSFLAIGAAVTAGVFLLVGAFGAVLTVIGMAASGLGALGLSFATVLATLGPITLAIGALIAVGVLLYQNWDVISQYASKVWDEVVAAVKPAIDTIVSFVTEKVSAMSTWWKSVWPDMKVAFTNIWDAIVSYIGPKLETIKAIFIAVWPYIQNIVTAVWEGIKGVINGAITIIKGSVEVFIGLFTGDWERMWKGAQQIVQGGWDTIKALFNSAIQVVLNVLGGLVTGIATYFEQIGKRMSEYGGNIVKGLGEGITSMTSWIKSNVISFVTSIADTIKSFFGIASPSKLMAEYGGYLVEGLWQGINSMIGWISGKVTEFSAGVAQKIRDFFGIASPSKLMADYGQFIAEGLAVGMRDNEKAVADAAKAQADIVKAKTKEAKDAAVLHWQEMKDKVKTNADLMSQAITDALGKVRETTNLELEISRQEFELFASTLGTTTKDQAAKLQAQMELLRIELSTSKENVDLLNNAYDQMVKVKGENSIEAQKLYLELLKEQTAYQGIKSELAGIEEQIKKTTAAQQALTFEAGKWYEMINGNKVQVGGGGSSGGSGSDYPDGMPDWLKPGGPPKDDKGDNRGRDATDPNDPSYSKDDRYTWDDKEDRWWDNEDGGWEGGSGGGIFGGLANGGTTTRRGMTLVGEDGPELLDLARGSRVTPLKSTDQSNHSNEGIDYNKLAAAIASVLLPNVNVTIPAKDVAEFKSVTDLFKRLPQVSRQLGN